MIQTHPLLHLTESRPLSFSLSRPFLPLSHFTSPLPASNTVSTTGWHSKELRYCAQVHAASIRQPDGHILPTSSRVPSRVDSITESAQPCLPYGAMPPYTPRARPLRSTIDTLPRDHHRDPTRQWFPSLPIHFSPILGLVRLIRPPGSMLRVPAFHLTTYTGPLDSFRTKPYPNWNRTGRHLYG